MTEIDHITMLKRLQRSGIPSTSVRQVYAQHLAGDNRVPATADDGFPKMVTVTIGSYAKGKK